LQVFGQANAKKTYPTVHEDLRHFAFDVLPGALARQTNNYETLIDETAERLHEVNGPRDALDSSSPAWKFIRPGSRWAGRTRGTPSGQARPVARRGRRQTRRPRPATPQADDCRVEADLALRDNRNRYVYHKDYGHFWAEKRDDFAATAEQCLPSAAARVGRPSTSLSIFGRASIAAIGRSRFYWQPTMTRFSTKPANKNGSLARPASRWGESIALLEPLVERQPDNMQYRAELMAAYFHTSRPEELRRLANDTDAHFHEAGRWTEPAMAGLADACQSTGLNQDAIGYYREAIAVCQRQQPIEGR